MSDGVAPFEGDALLDAPGTCTASNICWEDSPIAEYRAHLVHNLFINI